MICKFTMHLSGEFLDSVLVGLCLKSYGMPKDQKKCQVKSMDDRQCDAIEFWEDCTDKLVFQFPLLLVFT